MAQSPIASGEVSRNFVPPCDVISEDDTQGVTVETPATGITANEIKFYLAATVSDDGDNGGRMGEVPVISGIKNNVLPDVRVAEGVAGITRYRKLFARVENADGLALCDARLFLDFATPGDAHITLFPGTMRDVQANIAASREYGVAALASDVTAGARSFVVSVTSPAVVDIFQDGDTVHIGNGTHCEFFENVSVHRLDAYMVIVLDRGDTLANAYSKSDTVVSSVIEVGDIEAKVDGWIEMSGAGTYQADRYNDGPLELDHVGTVHDLWTLVFTSQKTFNLSGKFSGELEAGSIDQDYTPSNPSNGRPYFTLRAAYWGGTWAAGDTIIFVTLPAVTPFWIKETVPAGTTSSGYHTFGWVLSA